MLAFNILQTTDMFTFVCHTPDCHNRRWRGGRQRYSSDEKAAVWDCILNLASLTLILSFFGDQTFARSSLITIQIKNTEISGLYCPAYKYRMSY